MRGGKIEKPRRKGNTHILKLIIKACEMKYGRILTLKEFEEIEPEAHAILFKTREINNKKVDPKNLSGEVMQAAQGVRTTYAELLLSSLAQRNPLVDKEASKTVSDTFGLNSEMAEA